MIRCFLHVGRLFWLLLLVIFAVTIDHAQLVTHLRAVPILPVICALTLGVPLMLLKGLRWHFILATWGISIPWHTAARLQCVSAFAGSLTPAQGGDIIKIYYLHRDGNALGPGMASVAADRMLDVVGMLLLILVGIMTIGGALFPPLLVLATVITLLIVGVLPLLHSGLRGSIRSALRFMPQDYPRSVPPAPSWQLAGLTLLTSIGALTLAVIRTWLVVKASGILLPSGAILLLTGASALAGLVSILGLGSRDAVVFTTLSGMALQGTVTWIDQTRVLPDAIVPVSLTISALLLVMHLLTVAAGGVIAVGLPMLSADSLRQDIDAVHTTQ